MRATGDPGVGGEGGWGAAGGENILKSIGQSRRGVPPVMSAGDQSIGSCRTSLGNNLAAAAAPVMV